MHGQVMDYTTRNVLSVGEKVNLFFFKSCIRIVDKIFLLIHCCIILMIKCAGHPTCPGKGKSRVK